MSDNDRASGSGPDTASGIDSVSDSQVAPSSDHKIRGKKPASSGTGVLGHNTATSGTAFGVEGVTDSATDGAAGVRGVGTATSGGIYGVLGLTDSPSSIGIVGAVANSAPLIGMEGNPTGVWGHTDKSSADPNVDAGYGVYGASTASSGLTFGVVGRTFSPDGWGVFSVGDSRTDGTHEVAAGTVHEQRGDPATSELQTGAVMTYNSDGSGTGSPGDLVYAINDGGMIKTKVIISKSSAEE